MKYGRISCALLLSAACFYHNINGAHRIRLVRMEWIGLAVNLYEMQWYKAHNIFVELNLCLDVVYFWFGGSCVLPQRIISLFRYDSIVGRLVSSERDMLIVH